MTENEIDFTYVIGEVQNLQTEIEQYFGEDGIVLPGFRDQLEGLEARVKEQGDLIARLFRAVEALTEDVASNPYAASELARSMLYGA